MKLYAYTIELRNKYGYVFNVYLVSILNKETGLIESSIFELSNKHQQVVFEHTCLMDIMAYVKEM